MTDNFNNQDFDDIFEGVDFEIGSPLDGDERTVVIRTSSGSQSVPYVEGITLEEAIQSANISLQTRAVFYLDDAEIQMDTVLPAGAVVTGIGAAQKGG